jgi:hypothetical protein
MSNQISVVEKLNSSVSKVLTANEMQGFEKSFLLANAIKELKLLLTSEYMKPIMEMQGNKLGFKSDKVYAEDVVKNCLIEAVLTGVQPFGNQFNIIAGNCYITKEGFGYLLGKFNGLNYKIISELPRIKDQSAAVVMNIEWTLNGVAKKESIDFPIKVNAYMGADAVIGKATRKARAWLYNQISGNEVGDGEVDSYEKAMGTTIDITPIDFTDLEMLYEMKKAFLTPNENEFAKRILDNKETASYNKLNKQLQSK